MLPPPWNLRSRLHEYGGRPWLLTPDGTVVFAHHADQRLYALTEGGTPVPLTPEPDRPAGWRYAEPVAAPEGAEVWCVREQHHGGAARRRHPGARRGAARRQRRRRPGRRTRARHRPALPGLPAGLAGRVRGWPGSAGSTRTCRGTPPSCGSPTSGATAPSGRRAPSRVAPRSRWSSAPGSMPRPWRSSPTPTAGGTCTGSSVTTGRGRRPLPATGGVRRTAVEDRRPLVAAAGRRADPGPARVRPAAACRSSTPRRASCPTSRPRTRSGPATWRLADDRIVGVAGGPDRPWELVEVDLATGAWTALPRAAAPRLPVDYLSEPQRRTFTGVGGREVHAVVHPPRHPDHVRRPGPPAAVPRVRPRRPDQPLPTGRGPGDRVLHQPRARRGRRSNYGGSTGYGRAYRERLREQLGRRRRRGLRGGRARPGRRGHRRPGAAGDPRRQRGRLDVRVRR